MVVVMLKMMIVASLETKTTTLMLMMLTLPSGDGDRDAVTNINDSVNIGDSIVDRSCNSSW